MRAPVLYNAALGLSNDPGWKGEAPLWFDFSRRRNCRPTTVNGSGRSAAGSSPRSSSGLLQRDFNSYLYLDPGWKPAPPITLTTGQFTFADLLKYAGAA